MNKYCKISLIILFFTLCTSIKSQEKFSKESADSLYKSNLYFRALVTGIDKMYKSWGKMDDGYGNQIRTDYKNMIVEDNGILSKVPEKYGPYTIQYLTPGKIIERYGELHKEFSVLRINKMETKGQKLLIDIHVVKVDGGYKDCYENHMQCLYIGEGCLVEFKLDCRRKEFVISKAELWGI